MVLARHASQEDRQRATRRRREAAQRYRPGRVRLLIISQMPPFDLERYFYFTSVAKADYLFRAVVPHLLGVEPARLDKHEQLSALQALGVFVIDLKPDPCDPAPVGSFVADLVQRAVELDPDYAVIIKVDVHRATFNALREAGVRVIDERLPFPSSGQQKAFGARFRDALAHTDIPSRGR